MKQLEPKAFAVPLLPPSVNHYKQPRRGGGWFRAAEAISFIEAVCIFSRKDPAGGQFWNVELTFYLGPGKHRLNANDADNFSKVALDALAQAGVIGNDARVMDLTIHKRFVSHDRDARTEYVVIGLEASSDEFCLEQNYEKTRT